MKRRLPALLGVAALALTLLGAAPGTAAGSPGRTSAPVPYEVWLTDQNNTAGYSPTSPRGTHGGRLVIHDGLDLQAEGGPSQEPTVIDFAELYALDGPNNPTGANVVRPHMVDPSPDGRFVAVAFVVSGHVAILDAATHEPHALFRMSTGAGGAIQAHAALWTKAGDALIVANQNGKLLERIDYDARTGTFTHDKAATLDLANCTTPSGNACQSATPLSDADPDFAGPDNRPDNAPICPVTTRRGHAMVTLRGGGMFVVDHTATPMAIVAAYGSDTVGRDGCGGQQFGNDIALNGGTGAATLNPHEFSLYHLKDNFPKAPATLADNATSHAPSVFFRIGDHEAPSDAHGMVVTGRGNQGYIWQFDRIQNRVEVFDTQKLRRVNTIQLTGDLSPDPAPDITVLSPDGTRVYLALRGPFPQTGAHAAYGSTPGLGIMTVNPDLKSGSLTGLIRTEYTNPVTGTEESDPHGVTVVVTQR